MKDIKNGVDVGSGVGAGVWRVLAGVRASRPPLYLLMPWASLVVSVFLRLYSWMDSSGLGAF